MKTPSIKLAPVKSSGITELGYDEASKTLAVKFASGGVYHSHGVPAGEVAKLHAAKSIGGHFAAHIRKKFKNTPAGGSNV